MQVRRTTGILIVVETHKHAQQSATYYSDKADLATEQQ